MHTAIKKKFIPEMRVEWPDGYGMVQSEQLMQNTRNNGAIFRGVFGVVDGGRLPCADYVDSDLQNAYYVGYTTCVDVPNLLVFNCAKEVIHAAMDFPGSWHDRKVAWISSIMYPLLWNERTPPGFAVLDDSTFAVDTKVNDGRIVRCRKKQQNFFNT